MTEIILDNSRKVGYNYHVEKKLLAGLKLEGWEVKALRAGRVSLDGAYVHERNGEMYVSGMHITPLSFAARHLNPEPLRERKLLLHRSEIDRLASLVRRDGYTIVPVGIEVSSRFLKMSVALAKGKKKFDKREAARKKDAERAIRREAKEINR